MDLDKLRNYDEWIGKTPQQIIDAVKLVGGWAVVFSATAFPAGLPLWAHRVRNYFNVEPRSLTRYDADFRNEFLARIDRGLDALEHAKKIKWLKKHPLFGSLAEVKKMPEPPPGTPDTPGGWDRVAEIKALSGDVYKDESTNMIWYQMDAGGAIYHFGSDPGITAPLEAFYHSKIVGQALVPIFKLVSPDGTGGSCETIINNKFDQQLTVPGFGSIKTGRFKIGMVSKSEPVDVNKDYHHQGSYNYAETIEMGLATHEKYDVHPHKKDKTYWNPLDRFLPLASRRFTLSLDVVMPRPVGVPPPIFPEKERVWTGRNQ